MRFQKIFPVLNLWQRISSYKIVIAIFDFVLLAFASYLGYAIRYNFYIPGSFTDACLKLSIVFPGLTIAIFAALGEYNTIWQHAGTEDCIKFFWSYIVSILTLIIVNYVSEYLYFYPRISIVLTFALGIIFCGGLRFSWLMSKSVHINPKNQRAKTLIIGAGEAGAFLARDLMRFDSDLYPYAFVDDDKSKVGRQVSGLKVLGTTEDLQHIIETQNFKVVLIAIPSVNGKKIRELYDTLSQLNVQVRILPSLRELAGGQISVTKLRNVKLEDLLGRDPVKINLDPESNYIKDKRVLITGAGGSIGSEIVRQVLHNSPKEVFVLGHGEQSIYLLLESLNDLHVNIPVKPIIADVADEIAITELFKTYRPQIIFHAAAHKHVPMMEMQDTPREPIRVNAFGTRMLARAAGKFHAERMVVISTDKAVNPSSIMGATKRLAEKVLEREQKNFPETKFMAVRFGNVLGSRGSVIPKFEKQIAAGGPVTVTHPDMKRYFMLIPEAVSLVIQAGSLGHGGELFVLDMGQPVIIREMAELLISLSGFKPGVDIKIEYTGIREGEKLYEELFYDENSVRKTQNPKIFVSDMKADQDQDNDTNKNFDGLLEYAVSTPEKSLEVLKTLVPEYVKLEAE